MKKVTSIFVAIVAVVCCTICLFSCTTVRENKELAGTRKVVSYEVLNVRAEPDSYSEIIGQLNEGDIVILSGQYTEGSGSDPKLPQSFGWYELEGGGWVVRKGVQ